jgi:hypothetical protein
LIGKQQDELLSGKTYIYQLFAKQSYALSASLWAEMAADRQGDLVLGELFGTRIREYHSEFLPGDDTGGGRCQLGVFMLLYHSARCESAQAFSKVELIIQVFDLPSVIIGQFLPIPTDI